MAVTINGSSGVVCPAGGTVNVAGSGVGTTDTQTLTNKVLTSPTITGTIGGSPTLTGYEQIVQGTAQATTSGTAVGFTGLPSWVKRITFVLSGLSNSAGNPVIQLGSGSYTTSGYAGYCTYQTAGTNALANVSSAAGFPVNAGAALVTGSVILTLINSSTNTWAASGQHYSALGTVYLNTVYGYIALAGVLDRIQIATTTGTFSTGTVNIIYEG